MNFDQSDDRRMLSETLTRFLAETYDIKARNAVAYDAPFHSPDRWTELAELGVLYALADEDHGGFGGGGFDIMTVFQALGAGLCPEPVLSALLAARLLSHTSADLEPLLTGATNYAVAINEMESSALDDIETTATGGTLTGRKSVVYGAHIADKILVVARDGETLALYEINAADAEIIPYGMIDGGGAAEVFLDATPADLLLPDAKAAVQDALDAGALALSAEALGAMETTRDMLIDYLKQRRQFGRAIGSFQALQHRAVELVTEIEQARSIVILAASKLGEEGQSRTASMCKNLSGRAAVLVAEEAIQMCGGIAMTWEYPVSHFAKRLVMIDAQLGDTDHHLKRVIKGLQAL